MIEYSYDPPYNLWSGNRSDTLNKWKINYKGSIATASALPEKGDFKGDTYNVLEDGSNYMWNGSSWDKLDANVYVGATSEANGIRGLVPPATTAQMYSLLTGMGTWQSAEDLGLALDDEVVHLVGNEEINGFKAFSSEIRLYKPNITKGITPSNRTWFPGLTFCDKNHTSESVLTGFSSSVWDNGDTEITLSAYKNAASDNTHTYFQLKMTSNDNKQIFTDATHLMHDSSLFAIHGTFVGDDSTDAATAICCGRNNARGASLQLYGRLHSVYAGKFYLRASTKTEGSDTSGVGSDLVGFPNGTLTWTGQNIQTSSDARLKTTLSIVSDEVLDAWSDVSWGEFKYLDAVKEKGENARLHLGVIAQQIKEVFENHGLDACAYGILCHEKREATDEEPAFDMWMVRYAEAQAMEAAYQRRRAERAEARIKALEDRLEALEAKFA